MKLFQRLGSLIGVAKPGIFHWCCGLAVIALTTGFDHSPPSSIASSLASSQPRAHLTSAAVPGQSAGQSVGQSVNQITDSISGSGVSFSCDSLNGLRQIEAEMDAYLSSLEIAPNLYVKSVDSSRGTITFKLDTPDSDVSTLDFIHRPEYDLRDEIVHLPSTQGKSRGVRTVSRKEIALALMQNGRLTEFKGPGCSIEALKDEVGVRQNIVAWSEVTKWVWPEGGPAAWNKRFWDRGTPLPGVPLRQAMLDAWLHQEKYALGCYTAAKMNLIQGVLDYYHRVKKDPTRAALVEKRLYALDQDPLVGIEPERMWWFFIPNFAPSRNNQPGKILKMIDGVAAMNFVPGDWLYFLNTDEKSAQKTGYEGSNVVYLGRNRLNDLYASNSHKFLVDEKIEQIYQWRFGVINDISQAYKMKPLTRSEVNRLMRTPREGGFLLDYRVVPYQFGFEALPELR